MGTCLTKDKTEHAHYGFSAEEFEQIKKIYQTISEHKLKTLFRRTIGKKGLQHEFPENPDLALKIYNWMVNCSAPEPIAFESYLHCIQLLTHKTTEFKIISYSNRSYEPIETTALISIEKYLKEKEEVPQTVITYAQGSKLIKEILNMFRETKPNAKTNELPAKVLAQGIFTGNNRNSIDFNVFLSEIKQQLELINYFLRVYYYSRFIDRGMKQNLRFPFLDSTSLILNDELLSLFCLTCERFQRTDELTLLYASTEYLASFEDLVLAIEGYDGPTLILVKHASKGSPNEEEARLGVHVFGGFANTPWKNQPEYHGDNGNFVFSLLPKFRKYYPKLNSQNYQYLNHQKNARSKFVNGLGFGGANDKSFRLWIDDAMNIGTFTSPEDQTYEKGHLLDPAITYLNIEELEIWGLGGLSARTRQEIYRSLNEIAPAVPKRKTHVPNKKGLAQLESNTNGEDIGFLPVLGYDQDNINAD